MHIDSLRDFATDLYRPILGWDRKGIGMLMGREGIYRLALRWEYAFAASGFKVFNLDCAIRFNPFTITAETRRDRVPPEELLQNILIQRAFTPYQILDSLLSIVRNRREDTIYFLLAPCKQFFDGDVQEEEGRYLLDKMHLVLELLRDKELPVLVIESLGYSHPTFQRFFPKLIATADDLWELKIESGHSYLKTRKGFLHSDRTLSAPLKNDEEE
ncbi:hypothetical protein LEP1GSC047_2348 [Leptospira inadai serovar Lyme str. 10]|uniref:Uncharacterized protein n=2 Tax=Leptospira inadai serovar Lyme TaxID=293084 RepID=V6HFI2_9LEPT|nr:hypothetical protein [Leptospira inadai]EQA38438.1 hypothetical protein LEP1GSC047_2348 [Leptospira inadai serovar Lyme str. 10]PNV72410.1 hypothetical protein BES34_019500 [Leptospira inadai serovar Lyme]